MVKSPTKLNEAYYPFGRPGGGAPIKDDRGNVRANVTGIVENEKTVSSRLLRVLKSFKHSSFIIVVFTLIKTNFKKVFHLYERFHGIYFVYLKTGHRGYCIEVQWLCC